jgi:hypothetical protein
VLLVRWPRRALWSCRNGLPRELPLALAAVGAFAALASITGGLVAWLLVIAVIALGVVAPVLENRRLRAGRPVPQAPRSRPGRRRGVALVSRADKTGARVRDDRHRGRCCRRIGNALKRLRRFWRAMEWASARSALALGVWCRSPIDARPAPVASRDAAPTRAWQPEAAEY